MTLETKGPGYFPSAVVPKSKRQRESKNTFSSASSDNEDVVCCLECGFKASTLATHLRRHGMTAKDYLRKYPGSLIRSRNLSRKRSQAIARSWKLRKEKRSQKATKQIECPRCGALHTVSLFLAPKTHNTHCKSCARAIHRLEQDALWEGKKTPDDYVVCLECGHRARNLTSHIRSQHRMSLYKEKYPDALLMALNCRSRDKEALRLHISLADLMSFTDDKGRVLVAQAAEFFGCAHNTMKRLCRRLGVPTYNRLAFQKRVLDSISQLLGGASYEWEYKDDAIRSPKTGYCLRYDGFFPALNLLVEVHGFQHEKFVPYWHKTQDAFEYRKYLDEYKKEKALEAGYRFLVIRQSQANWNDSDWLSNELRKLGASV